MITIGEAAEILRVSESTIRRWISEKESLLSRLVNSIASQNQLF